MIEIVKVVELKVIGDHSLREAIRFHIEGLKEDGLPIPPPSETAERRVTAAC